MGNFLTWNFWFSARPGVLLGSSFKTLLGFAILLFFLAIIAHLAGKKWSKSLYANFWRNIFYFFSTNSAIGLVLLFFNYEMVPFLSSRFWFLLWAIEMAVWFAFIYKILIQIPRRKEQLSKEKEFKKYLPK